jgi:hypothetical protein
MGARVVPQMYCDADAVRRFIAEYAGIDLKHVTDETHLTDLGLDWLDQLDLMVLIEDEYLWGSIFSQTLPPQTSNWSAILSGILNVIMPRRLAERQLERLAQGLAIKRLCPTAAFRRLGPSRNRTPVLSCGTTMDRRLLMSISRTSRGGDRQAG